MLEFTHRKISGFNQKGNYHDSSCHTDPDRSSDRHRYFRHRRTVRARPASQGSGSKLVAVSGTVDYKKLCVAYNIQDDVLATFRKAGRADIRVTPTE
jgi:hypothetical protein